MNTSRMRVRVVGGPTREPIIEPMRRGATISRELEKRVDGLSNKTPLLLHAPPGSGKTTGIINTVLPWVQAKGWKMLYVSSRVPISQQFKRALIQKTHQEQLLQERTSEGLRALEEIGCVTTVTYHRLYNLMQLNQKMLRDFDVLVFDEVHALLDDALFVANTGYILEHLLDFFAGAVRVYLTATPQTILPLLAKAETPYQIQVLRFPVEYDYVRPYFFNDVAGLIDKINRDVSTGKWLIFSPSIAEGELLKTQLSRSVRLLNGAEREKNPDKWHTIIDTEKFEEDVCIATAVIDAGVNFKDPLLRNVVVFSLNPNTIVQFLGRKRHTASERVNFYAWCPTLQDLHLALRQNAELASAVELYYQDNQRFLQQHILPGQSRDLRGWVRATENGKLELNPLVSKSLQVQRDHLEKLLQRATENKGDCQFDRFVASLLRIPLPDRSECWLDPRYSGTAKAEFEQFLSNSVEKPMNEDEFSGFCDRFRTLCIAAYGTNGGKDRSDRSWGFQKIFNRLVELDNGYILRSDSAKKSFILAAISVEPDAKQEG